MADAAEWDRRFQGSEFALGLDPEPFFLDHLRDIPRGLALDVACGEGRHSVAMARESFRVVAVDRSIPAVAKVRKLARALDVPSERLLPVAADLSNLPLPKATFHLILQANFLDRALFPSLVDALVPGGTLLLQTFSRAHPEVSGRGPSNPDFLLRENEILRLVPGLRIVLHEEVQELSPSGGRRAVVRLRAQKPLEP